MDDKPEKDLTSEKASGIIPTHNELRMLENLREEAKTIHNGEIDVTYQVHIDAVKYGQVTGKRRRL